MGLVAYRHETERKVPHLRVRQAQYSDEMKHRLQRVGSPARWLPHQQAWDYPMSAAAVIALDAVAKATGETIEWKDGLRDFAEQHVKQAEREHEVRIAIERIIRDGTPLDGYVTRVVKDDGEKIPPLRHQQIAFHWSQRVVGLLLAHDPGCGKTRSATDAMGGWYRNGLIRKMDAAFLAGKPGVEGGVLVVCPKTMMRTWQEEVAQWQNANGLLIFGSSGRKTQLAGSPAHVHIINYEGLKYVEHNRYDAIIADEIHRCSNNSLQMQYVLGLSQRARKKLGLSGTPITNSLESIFYPMLILDGGKTLGSSKTAFLEKYFNSVAVAGFTKHDPKADAAEKIAAAMAASTYFVKKEEVLDLPEKTFTPVYLAMTDEQARYYKQLREEAITYIQDETVTIEQASAKATKLLQTCQGFVLTDSGEGRHFSDAKTNALMELLTDTLAERKTVCWTQFRYEADRLVATLKSKGINHVRIDGSVTSQRDRDAAMDAWNTNPDIKVYVRQLSMSEGVTLHAKDCIVPCYDCVYVALNYRLVDLKQSMDRIHRIGQKYHCNYTFLLTENGIDRKVYNVLLDKAKLADLVSATGKDFYLKLLRA
jgi:SNF2 family DNA or RNA helicase